MAAYPTELPICKGSVVEPVTAADIDRASNGDARGRVLHTVDKHRIRLVHQALDATARAVLDAFYAANRIVPVDVAFGGATYLCLFARPPRYSNDRTWLYADATVELVEV